MKSIQRDFAICVEWRFACKINPIQICLTLMRDPLKRFSPVPKKLVSRNTRDRRVWPVLAAAILVWKAKMPCKKVQRQDAYHEVIGKRHPPHWVCCLAWHQVSSWDLRKVSHLIVLKWTISYSIFISYKLGSNWIKHNQAPCAPLSMDSLVLRANLQGSCQISELKNTSGQIRKIFMFFVDYRYKWPSRVRT